MLRVRIAQSLPRLQNSPINGRLNKILVILADHLGDTALSIPLLRQLRGRLPEAEITLVVRPEIQSLFAGWKNTRTLPISACNGATQRWLLLPFIRHRYAREHLWNENFNICLIPRYDSDHQGAVLLGYFSGASQIISFSEKSTPYKSLHNRHYDKLLTRAVNSAMMPEAEINLKLLNAIEGLPSVAEDTIAAWELTDLEFARKQLDPDYKWVAISPGSGSSRLKQWGIERWARVAAELSRKGYAIVIVGGSAEHALAAVIQSAVSGPCLNLTGKTNLSQLAAILNQCALFLGNDAGPLHLASALNQKSLAVFGASCRHRYGAWGKQGQTLAKTIPCSPCHKHPRDLCRVCRYASPLCMSLIQPEEVLKASQLLLLGNRHDTNTPNETYTLYCKS